MRNLDKESKYNPTKSYVLGLIFSVIVTLVAYTIVVNEFGSRALIITSLMALAMIQVYIQLRFFLHMNKEEKPKLNTMSFLFMMLIVLILVIGSLWIMENLNYNMMPDQVDQYIMEDEGISK